MKITLAIWDLPLRLFHWLLAAAVIAAYATAQIGGALIDWHGRIGIFILGLLIFRIIWGFIGPTHARFVSFFPTLPRVIAYLKGRWQGIGHNPLGGIAVIALLTATAVQVGTGLFANDDIGFEGPLVYLIDKSQSDHLTGLHSTVFNVLMSLVGVHVLAIIFYRWFKKTNLVLPMLTGKKEVPLALAESIGPHPLKGYGALRLILTLIISSTVVWGVSGGIATLSTLYPLSDVQQTAQAKPSF